MSHNNKNLTLDSVSSHRGQARNQHNRPDPWNLVSSRTANKSTLSSIVLAILAVKLANATKTTKNDGMSRRATEQQLESFGGQAFERTYTDSRSSQRLVQRAIQTQDNQVIIIITTALPRSTNDELNKSFPSLAAGQRWFSNLPWVSQGLARANLDEFKKKCSFFLSDCCAKTHPVSVSSISRARSTTQNL